jgi:hypothetical protein
LVEDPEQLADPLRRDLAAGAELVEDLGEPVAVDRLQRDF